MKIPNIFDMYPYYNVPPCPACGSPITGRYVRQIAKEDDKRLVMDGLKHGEIIKTSLHGCRDRCFCLECMHEWEEHVSLSFVSRAQLAEEREKRHIMELQDAMNYSIPEPPQRKLFGIF